MRVSGNQNHVQQMCALYNKGIGAGVCADNFLKVCGKKAADSLTQTGSYLEEAGKRTIVFLKNTAVFLKNTVAFLKKMLDFLKINEKKMVNYLAVPNNLRTLSLSLSLSLSLIYLA